MNLQEQISRIQEMMQINENLDIFIRRRFNEKELDGLIQDVKELIEYGENVEISIYDAVREFIKDRKFADIDEFGDDQSYWDSYLKYEKPLVNFVKEKLEI